MGKKKIIASSILSLAMCASVITGATFSLATSNSEVNIAVQAGNVNVTATLGNLKTFSAQANADNSGYDEVAQTEGATETFGTFVNGGTAEIKDGTLTLDRMIHGDKATFDIVFDNQSNIDIQYQTVIQTIEDTGLFSGLVIEIDGQSFNGFTAVSDWKFLEEKAPVEKSTWSCSVSLPIDAESEYQGKSTNLSVSVNAVQGNAIVETLDENTVGIYTVTDMISFAKSVNEGSNAYTGKTVKLMKDIDLAGIDWTPISQTGSSLFYGNFNGQGHTIKNMTVNETNGNRPSGLFGWIEYGGVKIENLIIDNATVNGNDYAGGIAGYISSGDWGAYSISNCKVTNSKISADKSVGAIVGHIGGGNLIISTATSTGNTLTGTLSDREFGVGAIFGRSSGGTVTTMSKVTVENNVISQEEATSAQVSEYYGTCYGTFVLDGKMSGSASSSEALGAMFEVANSVTLTDGEFSDAISVPEGKELVVENVQLDSYNGYDVGVSVGENSTLILNGGTITAFEYAQVIDAQAEGAEVIVNGGSYEGNYLAFVNNDAKVTVNDCTFATEDYPATVIVAADSDENNALLTINGGVFYSEYICNNKVKVEITGGTFYITEAITQAPGIFTKDYITITGGTFLVDPSDYLTADYVATQNDAGMWVVSAKL